MPHTNTENPMVHHRTNDLAPGHVIDGRYELVAKLGEGGMGEVWEAEHVALGARRALKLIHPERCHGQDATARFVREARACSAIEHPGVVRVHDTGAMADRRLYMVMDLLRGTSIADRLGPQPLAQEVFLSWGIQVCDVLCATHAVGLVHRDLKPDNLMLEPTDGGDERVVVVDFGLAFSERDERLGRLTDDHIISGTPLYLSPEQALGGALDIKTDVYSLGVIFYEWLTGVPPFESRTPTKMLIKHMLTPAPRFAQRTASQLTWQLVLEPLVMRMLDKDPTSRPEASEVLERLHDIRQAPGHQGRGRDASWHQPRHARMVRPPTVRTNAASAPKTGSSNGRFRRVGFDKVALDDELTATLRFEGYVPIELEHEDAGHGVDIIVFSERDAQHPLARPSVGTVGVLERGDLDGMARLSRSACDEVLSSPIDPIRLIRKLDRVRRTLERRNAS